MTRFIIARPREKALQTVNHFCDQGLTAIPWYVLDIRLLSLTTVVKAQAHKFDFNTIIITSTYAIDWLSEEDGVSAFDLSNTKNIICVGNSTAEKLKILLDTIKPLPHTINLVVAEPANSEGILASASLQNIKGQSIAIVKGCGGRSLLERELAKRDANITVLDVYQRMVNTQTLKDDRIRIGRTDCLVATSVEIVEAIFNNYDKASLTVAHWIVPSARIKQRTESLGGSNVWLSANASANSLVRKAIQLVKTGVIND